MPGASPAQTIGPFFAEGLKWAIDLTATSPFTDNVQITGRVLDADSKGVADALIEIWQPHADVSTSAQIKPLRGFQRVASDADGHFTFWMPRPGEAQKYAEVTLFARGLLRHLFTRVYVHSAGEFGNYDIPSTVPDGRHETIIAKAVSSGVYQWNITLSGKRETVFFDL
jgi:protocatechuate 3,4-dioxygenase alpha subunit